MGTIYVRDCDNLPYGPGQSDYEYDGRNMDKPMSDFGKQVFETLNLANEAARIHVRLGRQQFAEEVRRIIGTMSARKDAYAVVNELIALCGREVQP